MDVRVVEARHDERAVKIDDFRIATLELLDGRSVSHSKKPLALHRQRFVPLRKARLVANVNVSVDVDHIRRLLGLRHTHHTKTEKKKNHPRPSPSIRGEKVFHSAAPASVITVSTSRLNPNSRFVGSYHSCKVCAPPPAPPAPIARASIPNESGMFASVDARCIRAVFPRCPSTARSTCSIRASSFKSAAGRLPIPLISAFNASDAGPLAAVGLVSDTASATALRSAASSLSISAADAERMSTRIVADSGMEFTLVPPLIAPMLNVVFGSAGTGVAANFATARDSATIGFGTP